MKLYLYIERRFRTLLDWLGQNNKWLQKWKFLQDCYLHFATPISLNLIESSTPNFLQTFLLIMSTKSGHFQVDLTMSQKCNLLMLYILMLDVDLGPYWTDYK